MAISINTHKTKENLVGKSHWWGAPDLPAGVPYPYVDLDDYPEPLTFVCQICLKDIAELDKANLLPHTGFLYFFAPLDYFLGEYDSPLDYHTPPVVLYSPIEDGLQPYVITWEGTDESIFRPAEAIEFKQIPDDILVGGHVLLGTPYQDEILQWNQGCVSLLQIDEDERWNLRFYDCGTYYFLIPKNDLKRYDWTKVIGEMFTY